MRRNLLLKGKTFSYLKYALGEIFLVVIGILIALEINNWNENRLDAKFEKEILAQIQENLIQDQKNLLDIKIWQKKALIASEKLIHDSIRTNSIDSVSYWLGDVVHFDRFQPLTNSYEALKSAGIQKINNKDLRNNIGIYYDDHVNHVIKSLGDIEYAFNNQWLPLMENHALNFEFKHILEVEDIDHFFAKTNGWRILMLNRDNIASSIRRLEYTLETLDETLSLMPSDIKTLK